MAILTEWVLSVLKSLSQDFPTISYSVILAYLPISKSAEFDDLSTIYPEGIECVPKKYAISYRNDWIVKKADVVICYIKHNYDGAAKFVEKAKEWEKLYVILLVYSSADITYSKIIFTYRYSFNACDMRYYKKC